MRHASVRILALPVAALLLLAQVAPMLWRMDCLMSGRAVHSWGTARSCMPSPEKAEGAQIIPSCCAFSHVGGERTEYVKQASVAPIVLDAVVVPWVSVQLHASAEATRVLAWARPPPDIGEDLSIRYRQLLI